MTDVPPPGTRLGGLRALVVEDEGIIAALIEEFLEDAGCTATWVPTLAEACAAARDGAFDVALVDRNLGGLDSAPVIAALEARAIPVVIASGYAPPSAKTPPDTITLRKPFTADELYAAMASATGRR